MFSWNLLLFVILRALARRISKDEFLAVSFTKIFTPFGRIFWELVANDLPPFLSPSGRRNGVRASHSLAAQSRSTILFAPFVAQNWRSLRMTYRHFFLPLVEEMGLGHLYYINKNHAGKGKLSVHISIFPDI
jgi:hypothetical protein